MRKTITVPCWKLQEVRVAVGNLIVYTQYIEKEEAARLNMDYTEPGANIQRANKAYDTLVQWCHKSEADK